MLFRFHLGENLFAIHEKKIGCLLCLSLWLLFSFALFSVALFRSCHVDNPVLNLFLFLPPLSSPLPRSSLPLAFLHFTSLLFPHSLSNSIPPHLIRLISLHLSLPSIRSPLSLSDRSLAPPFPPPSRSPHQPHPRLLSHPRGTYLLHQRPMRSVLPPPRPFRLGRRRTRHAVEQ